MNVWFVIIGFVLYHYVTYGEIYMYVCMYFFLVLLWSGCGISLPKIGHFNNGCYMWTRCKLCVWIEVCGVDWFSMNFCSRVCANPLCGIWRDVYVCMYFATRDFFFYLESTRSHIYENLD